MVFGVLNDDAKLRCTGDRENDMVIYCELFQSAPTFREDSFLVFSPSLCRPGICGVTDDSKYYL